MEQDEHDGCIGPTRPLDGWRYRPARFGDIEVLISQELYDVIRRTQRRIEVAGRPDVLARP